MRVSDTVSWTTNSSELKSYLGLNGEVSEDIRLRLWLEMAIEVADKYLDKDFVLIKARLSIQSGVGASDEYEIIVTPNGESPYTATYIASSGDTPSVVAHELRELLYDLLYKYDYVISGSSSDIWIYSGDPDLSFDLDANYTQVSGTSGFVANFFYDDIPNAIKFGIYEYVKALREIYNRAIGVKSVKTGALSESYAGGTPNEIAFNAAKGWWSIYKRDKLIDGGNN